MSFGPLLSNDPDLVTSGDCIVSDPQPSAVDKNIVGQFCFSLTANRGIEGGEAKGEELLSGEVETIGSGESVARAKKCVGDRVVFFVATIGDNDFGVFFLSVVTLVLSGAGP